MSHRWGTEREPVDFWTILFAVAGGVLLADVVRMLFAALAAGALLAGFSGALSRASSRLPEPPTVRELYPRPVSAQVEELLGPVQARASAVSRACIAGYAANRNQAGWDQEQPLRRCRASSE